MLCFGAGADSVYYVNSRHNKRYQKREPRETASHCYLIAALILAGQSSNEYQALERRRG
jgi:hypothetical protein